MLYLEVGRQSFYFEAHNQLLDLKETTTTWHILLRTFRLIMNINKVGKEWSELHLMIGIQAYELSLHGLHIQLKQNYLNRYSWEHVQSYCAVSQGFSFPSACFGEKNVVYLTLFDEVLQRLLVCTMIFMSSCPHSWSNNRKILKTKVRMASPRWLVYVACLVTPCHLHPSCHRMP